MAFTCVSGFKQVISFSNRSLVSVFPRTTSFTCSIYGNPYSRKANAVKSETTGVPPTGVVLRQNTEVLSAKNRRKNLASFNFAEELAENEALFKKTLSSLCTRKKRDRKGKIVVEGKHLIQLALDAGFVPETVFYSREDAIPPFVSHDSTGTRLLKVSSRALRDLSGLFEPPAVVAIFEKPVVKADLQGPSAIPVTVLCSNVRDPENLGSVLLVAAATGCRSVVLTKGCVDAWERKVLKAAEGVHFRFPIVSHIEWTEIRDNVPPGAVFYAADSSADIDLDESAVYSEADYRRATNFSDEDHYTEPTFSAEPVFEDGQLQLVNEDEGYPCMLYSAITFPKRDIVVYIGGETEGVDARVRELVRDSGGMSIKIPLENGMDSLNVCSALSIVLYEIKRQFSKESVAKSKHTKHG